MASTLTMPKSIEEIESPEALEDDFYEMRLVKDPQIMPNKVLRAYMKAHNIKKAPEALAQAIGENYTDEDGKYPSLNWVLDLRIVHEDPMVDGRGFRYYLPLPNDADKDRVNMLGQVVEDEKMEKIAAVAGALMGIDASGDTISLEANMSAMFPLETVVSFKDESKMVNQISLNQMPQPVM